LIPKKERKGIDDKKLLQRNKIELTNSILRYENMQNAATRKVKK
jgi:hypothetical protein